ncbi:hypothetical protein O1L55_16655 [Streptomyces albulus]|nr:hypothetical protein [Streptomyces noursei]
MSSAQVPPVPGGPRGRYVVRRDRAAPLVTVRRGPLPGPGAGPTPSSPARSGCWVPLSTRCRSWRPPGPGPAPERAPGGWVLLGPRLPTAPPGAVAPRVGGTVFTARCAPGGAVLWYAPWFAGEVTGPGVVTRSVGRWDVTAAPLQAAGHRTGRRGGAGAAGREGHQYVPERAVGCLPAGRLDAAVRALEGPVRLTAGGHDLTARLRPGRAGSAVLALPAVSGWGCSVDGGPPRAPGAFGGLLAVPLGPGATRLHCAYAPPGLAAGLVASGAGRARWARWPGPPRSDGGVRGPLPRPARPTPPHFPNSAFRPGL